MKPKLKNKLAVLALLLAGAGMTANAQVWLGGQLGNPTFKGSVTTNAGNLSIQAGGDDIWNTADNGYFYYTWAQGNWDAKVRVDSLDSGGAANSWRKAEMMVRWSDPAVGVQGSDGFIATMLAPGQGTGVGAQYRPYRAAGANNAGSTDTASGFPRWLRLTRTNNVFTVLSSLDDSTWTTHMTIDVTSTANGFGRAWPDLVTVGLAVTAHDDAVANSVTAVASQPTISSSKPGWVAPTAAGIKNNIASKTVLAGCEASFTFVATNNASPVTFPHEYQWYKNGTAVAGLTRNSIALLAAMTDSGTQFSCVSWPVGYPTVTVTSAVATLTVNNTGIITNGYIKSEIFANSTRADVYSMNVPSGDGGNNAVAGKLRWLDALQDGGGYGDQASRRYSGWFIPPADGAYTFYVAADDDTDVWLGTSADPTTKRIICQEMGWSPYNNWTNSGGAVQSDIDQKCSNTWTNGLGEIVNPAGITLVGGQRYYLETVVHNGTGGDNGSVTAQLFTDPPPQDGSATKMTSSTLALITWQPTTFTWTLEPQNLTAPEGGPATFRVTATSDGEFAPHYQWMRNGTNVTGANGTAYSIDPAQLTDSGATVQCVATIPMMNAITSQVATLTVQQSIFEPGFMLNQKWSGQNRAAVANGTYGPPTLLTDVKPGMAAAITSGEAGGNYTRKISGFFIPPATGPYTFYTTSDDYSDLYISLGNASQSANPANKTMIAQETGWSGVLNWVGVGAGDATMKCSKTWKNASGATPYANGIQLNAGQKYYMEVDQEEGGGGDNVAVTYIREGIDPAPVAGDQPKMVGSVVGFLAPQCEKVWFTLQPTNPAPVTSGPNTATFYAFGSSDSTLQVGNITGDDSQPVTTPQLVFFQWAKNGVDIPGATATSYTTPWLKPEDNGAQFACRMRALGYGNAATQTRLWSNSEPATLTVITNTEAPVITAAGIYTNMATGIPITYISVTFSLLMDTNTIANASAYSVPGFTVDSVQVNRNDGRRVLLTVTGTPSFPLNITVNGARSWSGIPAANTSVAVAQLPLTSADFGNDVLDSQGVFVSANPVFPSKLWVDGPRAYTIAAQGTDIWDTSDGFNFLYEAKDGDFDVVMRQTAYSLPNRWAKVGLMLRENVAEPTQNGPAAGSRNWNVVNDPPDVPTLSDGNGANLVECNWRPIGASTAQSTNTSPNLGHPSTGWGNGTTFRPQYPNAWVRLKRAGQVVSAYAGTDGMNWTELARMDATSNTNTPPIPTRMYVGICVTGHHNDNPLGPDYLPLPYEQQRFWNYASVDNYNSSYVAPPPSQTLTARLSGANVIVSWAPTGGTLYSSSDLNAPIANWTAVGTANPATIPIQAGPMYFRVGTPFNP